MLVKIPIFLLMELKQKEKSISQQSFVGFHQLAQYVHDDRLKNN